MSLSSQNRQVVAWRARFRQSQEPEGLNLFRKTMLEAAERMKEEPRATAFLATAEILVAGHRFNPISKWKGFRKWTTVLDEQVRQRPDDPDIRFLRLTVQANAPGFLGYSASLPSDCTAVQKSLGNRYWEDDPSHHAFVEKIIRETKACA